MKPMGFAVDVTFKTLIQSYNKNIYTKKYVILCFIVGIYVIHKRSMWSLSKLFRHSPMRLTLSTTSLVPKASAIHAASHVQHHDTINFEAYNSLRKAYQHSIKQSQLTLDPLLLNVFPRKKTLSGLIILTPKEQNLLEDIISPLGLEFKKYLSILYAKVCFHYNMIKYPTLEVYLTQGVKETFGSFNLSIFSDNLIHIVGHRTMSFIQHFATFISGHASFPSNILARICGVHINIDSYKDTAIKMLTFIELMHIKELYQLLNFSPKDKMISHMINSENLGNTAIYFNELVSKEQTGQKNCDAVITNQQVVSPSTLNQERKWYVDVKTFVTLGIDNQRFALFFPTSIKQIKTYVNNITTSLKRFIDNNKLQQDSSIIQYYNNIIVLMKKIKNEKDLIEVINTFNQIIKILITIFKEETYANLYIGLASPSAKDIDFSNFLETELKTHLEKLVKDPNDFKNMFPEDFTIDQKTLEESTEYLIKKIFAKQEMYKLILDTMNEWRIITP